jgi:hypothetical protein
LESLRSWTGLTGVGIDGLQLTDEAVQVLDDLGVGFVILSGPDVTDLHLMRIAELEAVTHLTLDQTSVTETGIAAFRLACPTCGISVLTEEQIWYQW